jgi:inner membrane protein
LDNLTHTMAGWALGQAGLKTKTRKGLAALILGANMPDIDVFFGNAPWDPLAIHRGFTHGIIGGVLVMPPILAGLLWLLDRWQVGRGKGFKSGLTMHFGWLLALSYIGAATHPLLDMLTTYSVQLLSPFSSRWYHADGLFIIDV